MTQMLHAVDDLDALFARDAFVARHVGPDAAEEAAMLRVIGGAGERFDSAAALAQRVMPAGIALAAPPELPEPVDEAAIIEEMRALSRQNRVLRSLIGAGYYGTHVPPVIQRNVLENPGWYTAYTPYQAEISQGRLEALLAFQTMVADLTGLPVANASLLDEPTAAAEAVAMARAAARNGSRTIAIADDVHPQTRAVIATRANALGLTIVDVAAGDAAAVIASEPFALVLQYPGTSGAIRDLSPEIAAAQGAGALALVASDLLALTLLKPPGEMGADIVVGSAQRFGVPMGFGGPHAGFLATRDAHKRLLPGRLVGVSIDADGQPALRLALQTREQHIRREKATSNICTAQVLLAVMAAMYAVWHGADGLRRIARRASLEARLLAEAARSAGVRVRHAAFFDTVALECASRAKADAMMEAALGAGFNLRRLDDTGVGVAFDETVRADALYALALALGWRIEGAGEAIPAELARTSPILRAPVFGTHRTEHEMLRYLERLEARDISLTRGMIPLGSCTMKLNASAQMAALSLPGFADIHPFAPPGQTQGYATMIALLSEWLAAATGFAAVSLQPNAGSQGEFAGLLAIRAWQAARGEGNRDVCLIPASAHGTNPASAVIAGLRVIVVGCGRDGNIDLADLRAKIDAHAGRLAALMVTYPSTHGVFEEGITEICQMVHAAGGQVYMDGANLNAQLGLTSPGRIGADVCHLNLHKTFCIPHGGGGPGVGPIAVAAHLAPYLPNHPARPDAGPASGPGPIAGAPFGSASILTIPFAYLRLMGATGLKRATEAAILNANYVAARLAAHYPILYSGRGGLVAHECIVDCRAFEKTAGIKVEDIAKRLQDYGYHAPTMSWPVVGTLMVEPTESETKGEIDRFCEAMIAIRQEIAAIEAGRASRSDNVLRHAPHTAARLMAATWGHAYSREEAAFPLDWVRGAKYWPPVARVDNVAGDRNLVCTCAPVETYLEAAE